MMQLMPWVIGILAALMATLLSIADSALLAFHASESTSASGPAFAERERLHRALSMARVLVYVAAGASLAQAMRLENAPIVLRVLVISVLAVIICVFSEGVGRAIGYSDAASMFKRLSPMMHGVGLALSPAVALGSALDRLLHSIIPTQRANESERETSTEQFREVVAAQFGVAIVVRVVDADLSFGAGSAGEAAAGRGTLRGVLADADAAGFTSDELIAALRAHKGGA